MADPLILDPRARRLAGLPPLRLPTAPLLSHVAATSSPSPTPGAADQTIPAVDQRGDEQRESATLGTPAAGLADSEPPYGYRRSGILGAAGFLGEAARAVPRIASRAMTAFGRGHSALTRAFIGENTPLYTPPEPARPTPPATSIGQAAVHAAGPSNAAPTIHASTGEPAAAHGSIEQARRARQLNARPTAVPLYGTPTYTDEDLKRVHGEGPAGGSFVTGTEEALPLEEQVARAGQRLALRDMSGPPGELTGGQSRAIAFETAKSQARFTEMDRLVDQDTEQTISELRADPTLTPMQKRKGIIAARADALEKKLENRRLGLAGWPRQPDIGLTGEPLYAPPTAPGR